MRKPSLAVVAVLLVNAVWVTSAFAADEKNPPLAKAPFSAEQAKEFQQQWSKHIVKPVVETNSIGMKMVLVPPGEYTMGRTEEQFDKVLEIGRREGREPARVATWEMLMMPGHPVRITKPFYMGATEVTVGQYREFCDASGYKTEAEQGLNGGVPYRGGRTICTWRKPMVWIKLEQKDDEPVLHLCWNDCVAFCKWLSEKEGVEYCLPTEAEWEYACRAGSTTAWCFGNFEDFDRLGHEFMFVSEPPQGKHDRPSSVAKKKPNAFGLYDMHGNVWEYVADWWHRFTYKNSTINDPTGPPEQSEKGDMRRIIRTGSFDWGRWGAQSVYRMRIGQRSTQHPHQGFRVAMRIKGVKGVSPATEPSEERRKKTIDPGADSEEVLAALKGGAKKVPSGSRDLPKELTIDLPGGVKMDYVLIPPGSFLMGSSKGFGDETPVHRVVISKPFYMAKNEVTTSQWAALMGKDARFKFWESAKGEYDDATGPMKAMRDVSWDECQAFVAALQKKAAVSTREAYNFALPTEAQWEYACRAGSTTEFHFGDDASTMSEYAWFAGNMIWPGGGRTFPDGTPVRGVHYHDVGQKKPNAFGLYDMHGGAWEWCADYYDKDYYVNSPLVAPTGPESGRFRTLRGGSWFRYAKYCRSAYRRFFYPACDGDGVTAYISDFGCRVVINLP
ncbi:MAG: SUMF1/EgtB/PvdO family nonheme iron enzyme [Planctomycetes bacterium]|nr:SUMF1/EgtB/PvdO family nonheme iron enzyme [Planctomycetota bacterium]